MRLKRKPVKRSNLLEITFENLKPVFDISPVYQLIDAHLCTVLSATST